MGRFPLKALVFTIFCVICVIAISACVMEPVGIKEFTEDEEVNDTIEKGAGIVNISYDSDPNLTAGNGKITGLDPEKYYTVEEWDENGTPLGLKFVSSNGTRASNLTGIGKASSGVLTGLTNYYHYRVNSARSLTGNVDYYYLSAPEDAASAAIDTGLISLKPPDNDDWLVFTPPLPSPVVDYDTVKLPVSPTGSTEAIPQRDYIAQSAAASTETDYVFFNRIVETLYVLKVVFTGADEKPPEPPEPPEPGEPGDLTVSVTFAIVDSAAVMTVSGNSVTQTDFMASGLTLSLSGAPAGAVISWRYDNAVVGNTLTFDSSNPNTFKYIIIGEHKISVEVTVDSVTYSKEFAFVVTNP